MTIFDETFDTIANIYKPKYSYEILASVDTSNISDKNCDILIGIYLTDLYYCISFNDKDRAILYKDAIVKLASTIQGFNKGIVERIYFLIMNKEYFYFSACMDTLSQQIQVKEKLPAIFLGLITEEIYILTHWNIPRNLAFMPIVSVKQKIRGWMFFPEFNSTLFKDSLLEFNDLSSSIYREYHIGEPSVDTSNGKITITESKCTDKPHIKESDFVAIKKSIEKLRNNILRK
jgi:hypothetical protein